MRETAGSFGANSMVAPLAEALVSRPGAAFARAFDDPAHGFARPVDLDEARRQHDLFCATLVDLGVVVHELGAETPYPDLVYTFDPALITTRGAVVLRPGKSTRRGEEAEIESWLVAHGIPVAARVDPPGTAEGGDVMWLRDGVVCIARSLRTNRNGAEQVAAAVDADAHVFDLPYGDGPSVLLHLLSVVSPVTESLVVAFPPLVPAGLYELLHDLGVEIVPVPEGEFFTLGCNVLAVRPGVVVMAEGNPQTAGLLAARGCEVRTFPASDIGLAGGGGPTCLTLPIRRERPSVRKVLPDRPAPRVT